MLNILLSKGTEYTCGGASISFDGMLPIATSTIVTILEIFVPIALVIFGMLDLGKAVIAQKEDEIKKGQSTFIKRLLAAVLVFFVIFIVKLVIKFVADDSNKNSVVNCLECFVSGKESSDACKAAGSVDGGSGMEKVTP